jgi:hypothetical protein
MAGTSPKRRATSTDEVEMLPNLRKTPHGYTYLKTVPADLREVLDKTVVKEALGRNYSVAKVRWAELEAETTALFQRLRQDLQRSQSEDDAIKAYLAKPCASRLKTLDAGRPGLAAQLSAVHLANLSADALARKDGKRSFIGLSKNANAARLLSRGCC